MLPERVSRLTDRQPITALATSRGALATPVVLACCRPTSAPLNPFSISCQASTAPFVVSPRHGLALAFTQASRIPLACGSLLDKLSTSLISGKLVRAVVSALAESNRPTQATPRNPTTSPLERSTLAPVRGPFPLW